MSSIINHKERVASEKLFFNVFIQNTTDAQKFRKLFYHADNCPAINRLRHFLSRIMSSVRDKDVLEIGAGAWQDWIDFENYPPRSLTCIDICELEVEIGKQSAEKKGLQGKINFRIMDAHHLDLSDNSIDVIYGGSMLHHLDFEKALDEIYRVLKPGGFILFHEPLRLNPISILIRRINKQFYSPMETPLGITELRYVEKKFRSSFHYYQLFAVPAGIISFILFNNPINIITRYADYLDMLIEKIFPYLRPCFRTVVIHGIKSA